MTTKSLAEDSSSKKIKRRMIAGVKDDAFSLLTKKMLVGVRQHLFPGRPNDKIWIKFIQDWAIGFATNDHIAMQLRVPCTTYNSCYIDMNYGSLEKLRKTDGCVVIEEVDGSFHVCDENRQVVALPKQRTRHINLDKQIPIKGESVYLQREKLWDILDVVFPKSDGVGVAEKNGWLHLLIDGKFEIPLWLTDTASKGMTFYLSWLYLKEYVEGCTKEAIGCKSAKFGKSPLMFWEIGNDCEEACMIAPFNIERCKVWQK